MVHPCCSKWQDVILFMEYAIIHIYHLFIHSSIGGHVGYSDILATVNNATINIRVHVSSQISVFIFFKKEFLEVGLLNHIIVVLFLIFPRNFHAGFHSYYTNLHSHLFFTFSSTLLFPFW